MPSFETMLIQFFREAESSNLSFAIVVMLSILAMLAGFFVSGIVFNFVKAVYQGVREACGRPPKASSPELEKQFVDSHEGYFRQFVWLFILPALLLILAASISTVSMKETEEHILSRLGLFLLTLLRWSIWSVAAFLLIGQVLLWYSVIRLEGRSALTKIYKTLRLWRLFPQTAEKTVGLIRPGLVRALLVSVASYFLLTDLLLAIAALFWMEVITSVSRYIMPPSVLLLGRSRTQSLVLQEVISEAIAGGYVCSLLDEDTYSGSRWARPSSFTLFRAGESEDWRQIVLDLAGTVRVIVLDAREVSNHVEWEMSLLTQSDLAVKTLIILSNDSQAVVPSSYEKEVIRSGAKSISIVELGSTLKNMFGFRFPSA